MTLSSGAMVHGCFFVAAANARSTGPERVGDLLNVDIGFVPFEVHDDVGDHTVLLNRAHIVTIALDDNEARLDPGYDVATRRVISVTLSNGERITGAVKVYRPEGRDRVSDWARHPDTFRYIESDDQIFIINVAHVISVSEASH